jgi:hypothetical protein
MTTPRLGAPEWVEAQALPATTGNEIVRYAEQGAGFFIVKNKTLTAPPVSPAEADAHIVASVATGVWTGHENDIAFYMGGAWSFITPIEGTHADCQADDTAYRFSGAAWAPAPGGGITFATASDINTGTDTTKAANSDALAGSNMGKRVVQIAVTDPAGAALIVGDGQAYFRVPSSFTGMNLVEVAANVITVSSSGIPTVQIHNVTGAVDMLSTKLTIDASETDSSTATTPAVIDAANDGIATANLLRIDVDVAGTGTKGLMVTLTFQLP